MIEVIDFPKHWEVKPAWSLFRRAKFTGFPDLELLSVYRDHGVVPKSSRDDNHNVASEDLNSYQLVQPGDLVVNKMKAWQGSFAISDYQGIVSPAYFVYKARHKENGKFLHYLLRSTAYLAHYNRISSGVRIGQWDLDPAKFNVTGIGIPPRAEQDAIAEFLDRELEQIDSLVEKQERLIELLANRKASSIAEAVTGESLDCRFTESPLPSLKRFPSAWKRGRVKQVGQVKLGKMIQQESKSVEDVLVPYLSSTSVQETGITVDQEKKMWASPNELVDLRIKKDDVLVLEGGAAGRSFRAGEDIEGVVFQNSLNRVRLDKGKVTPKFFEYWMSYLVSRGVVEAVCNKATIMHLTAEKLKDLPVLIPSLEEQVEITNRLDNLIEHSDRLTDRANKVLNVLAERRATLISAAVTGKLELEGAS